jgi:hypothetical protein
MQQDEDSENIHRIGCVIYSEFYREIDKLTEDTILLFTVTIQMVRKKLNGFSSNATFHRVLSVAL